MRRTSSDRRSQPAGIGPQVVEEEVPNGAGNPVAGLLEGQFAWLLVQDIANRHLATLLVALSRDTCQPILELDCVSQIVDQALVVARGVDHLLVEPEAVAERHVTAPYPVATSHDSQSWARTRTSHGGTAR